MPLYARFSPLCCVLKQSKANAAHSFEVNVSTTTSLLHYVAFFLHGCNCLGRTFTAFELAFEPLNSNLPGSFLQVRMLQYWRPAHAVLRVLSE